MADNEIETSKYLVAFLRVPAEIIGGQELWVMNSRFLIVEDDDPLRNDYLRYIADLQHEAPQIWRPFEVVDVGCAADAKAQLGDAALKRDPFEIMFLDLELPEHTGGRPLIECGLDVGKMAQNLGAVRRTVIVSGKLEKLSVAATIQSLNLGVTGFLAKGAGELEQNLKNAIIQALHSTQDQEFTQASNLRTSKAPECHSCFISYSSQDHEIATRLYFDLQSRGVPCWFAPEHLRIGDEIRSSLERAIHSHNRFLVLLSKNSIESRWVEQEVETVFELERQHGRIILFPVRLDDAITATNRAWATNIRRTRQIGDFRNWKNPDSYKRSFDRLLRDLQPEGKAESAAQK